MASIRFPNKILLNLYGLPMVEHVRRRALISKNLKEVYIATCDNIISNNLAKYGVKTIRTSKSHKNGTTRVSEAIRNLNCSHVILLQGDEPLLLPSYIDLIYNKILNEPNVYAWNLTAPINDKSQFKDKSAYIKILHLYRNSNSELGLITEKFLPMAKIYLEKQ